MGSGSIATTVITAEDIASLGIETLTEALRLVPGVLVQDNAMKARISIRGTGSFPYSARVRFMIDGIPINDPANGALPGFPGDHILPIDQIERIEVGKGPLGAIGAGSIWGVVNIVSRRIAPIEPAAADQTLGGAVRLRSTTNGEPMLSARHDQRLGRWLTSTSAALRLDDGGVRVTEGTERRSSQVFSSLQSGGFRAILNYERTELTPFDMRGSLNAGDYLGYYDNFGLEPPGEAPIDFEIRTLGSRERLFDTFLMYDRELNHGRTRVSTRLSYQARKGGSCTDCHTGERADETDPSGFVHSRIGWQGDRSSLAQEVSRTARGFVSARLDHQFELLASHQLRVGVEGNFTEVKRNVAVTLKGTDPDDRVTSAFVEDRMTLLPDRLWADVSARWDDHSSFGGEASWQAGVEAIVNSSWTVSARASSAPRFPTWDERFLGLIVRSETAMSMVGAMEAGTQDLVPERMTSFQVSIRHRPRPTRASSADRVSVHLDAYWNRIENGLTQNGVREPYQSSLAPMILVWENSNEPLEIKGFELGITYRLDRQLELRFGWAAQETDSPPDLTIGGFTWWYQGAPYAPANKLYFEILSRPREHLDIGLTAAFVDRQHVQFHMYPNPLIYYNWADEERIGPMPDSHHSYWNVNLSLGYELSIASRAARLGLRVDDIFDQAPVEYVHAQQDPGNRRGRKVALTAAWTY